MCFLLKICVCFCCFFLLKDIARRIQSLRWTERRAARLALELSEEESSADESTSGEWRQSTPIIESSAIESNTIEQSSVVESETEEVQPVQLIHTANGWITNQQRGQLVFADDDSTTDDGGDPISDDDDDASMIVNFYGFDHDDIEPPPLFPPNVEAPNAEVFELQEVVEVPDAEVFEIREVVGVPDAEIFEIQEIVEVAAALEIEPAVAVPAANVLEIQPTPIWAHEGFNGFMERIEDLPTLNPKCLFCGLNLFNDHFEVIGLHCGHNFHDLCIKRNVFLYNNTRCPLCNGVCDIHGFGEVGHHLTFTY